MINRYVFVSGFLLLALLFWKCSDDSEDIGPEGAPEWINDYPSTIIGASSFDLSVATNKASTVYYTLFSTAPADASALKIKEDAGKETGKNLLANGIINISKHGEVKSITIENLMPNNNYFLYLVAESKHDSAYLQHDADLKALQVKMHEAQKEIKFNSETYSNQQHYLYYKPEAAYRNAEAKFPLLIFLHGLGEKGTDINLVKRNGPPKIVEKGESMPFVIVSPQTPVSSWKVEFIDEILEHAKKQPFVDPDKIYLTGLSLGGGGSWAYAVAHPDKINAVAPVCGWGSTGKACQMKDLPTWAFHGLEDTTIKPEQSINMVNAVNDCGGNAQISLYQGVGHNSWSNAYRTDNELHKPNLWQWLLSK